MNETGRENVASLLPIITEFEKPFWDSLQKEQLLIQECAECGNTQFPPSPVCTGCLSDQVRWVPCSGRGSLWSRVTFHKAYLEPYQDVPYSVALMKLEEGHIVTARLPEEHRDLPLDSPISAGYEKTADGTVVIVCKPR